MSQQTLPRLNAHEVRAWQQLEALGARRVELGGKPALDVSSIRIRSGDAMARFAHAFNEVAGRSGAVRRHVDRKGRPVFVVADEFPTSAPVHADAQTLSSEPGAEGPLIQGRWSAVEGRGATDG